MLEEPRGILISGASSGIGRAATEELARRGFVVFAGARKPESLAALAQGSDRIHPIELDVTSEGSIRAAFEELGRRPRGYPLFGLVNNAGVALGGPLELVPLQELRRQLEVNVIGPIALVQHALPGLRQTSGRIVNIGSVAGRFAAPFLGPYCASKFALAALTDSLRRELSPFGISVSLVEPGAVRTPIWDKGETKLERLIEALDEEGRRLYGRSLERVRRELLRASSRAEPVQTVVEAIADALSSETPRPRYVVGRRATALAPLFRWVPDRMADRLVRLYFRGAD